MVFEVRPILQFSQKRVRSESGIFNLLISFSTSDRLFIFSGFIMLKWCRLIKNKKISLFKKSIMLAWNCRKFLFWKILKFLSNFELPFWAVFFIWKSLWVLQKACIKSVAHAIHTYLVFLLHTLLFSSKMKNKKLLWSLFFCRKLDHWPLFN